VGRNFAQDELLKDTGHGAASDADQGILDQQSTTAIAWRVVGVGDAGGDKASEDGRVIGLHAAVVAAANYRVAERVNQARLCCSRALVKVAWVLLEQRREDGAVHEGPDEGVGVAGAEALGVPLRTLPISADGSAAAPYRKTAGAGHEIGKKFEYHNGTDMASKPIALACRCAALLPLNAIDCP